jgi:tripartite-type tricarboxylate transporter receptor subunit TctC
MAHRLALCVCALAVATPVTNRVHAQPADSYPSRVVTMIVPFAPGAATDIEGRMYSNKLREALGQSFVLDYKPGGSMTVGMNYAVRQKPDGYTLLFVSASYSVLPLVFKNLPYDPIKNFEPISLLSKRSAIIAAAPTLPANNVKELVEYAKAHPTTLNFATAGNGSIQHLTGLWLQSATGTKFTFIHYKAAGAGFPDLMAGRAHLTPMTFQSSLPMVKSGKLKAIGVASLQRNALLPDLPTFHEQGVKDFEYSSWLGLLAPEKTPAAIVNKLQSELAKIVKLPDVVERLGGETTLMATPPAEFRRHVAAESARWIRLIKEFDISFDDAKN